MKRIIFALSALVILAAFGCQKGKDAEKEVAIAKKYEKYRVSIYKEKEMKTWLATLEKAEDVSLLSEENYKDNKSKGGLKEISKIKLVWE